MNKIYFAHLTDTHLNHDGKDGFLKTNTTKNLEKAIDCIQRLPNKLSFVIVTGDVAHEGNEEDYRYIKDLFALYESKLGVPILLTLGNHDHRKAFYKGYFGIHSEQPYMKSVDVNGLRVILLDSKVGDHSTSGTLGRDQLDWLKKELETDAEYGTVIAFHHPPEDTVLPLGELGLTDSEALKEVIKNSDVIGILTGHTHFPNQSMYDGKILNSTAGSTAFGLQMTPDSIRLVDTCSFNICSVLDKRLLVSSFQHSEADVLARFTHAQMSAMSNEFHPEALHVEECVS